MRSDEKTRFKAAILAVGEMFKEIPSKPMLELYWNIMSPFSYEEVESALNRHLADPDRGRFMPKPADLIAKVNSTASKEPLMGWMTVVHAMRKYGRYETVTFEDPCINAVIRDLGGWVWICDQNLDEPWTQKDFERTYLAYQARGIRSDAKLVGLHEEHNEARGFFDNIPELVRIGDGLRKEIAAGGGENDEKAQN